MPDIPRIVSAETVIPGVFKIVWDDDYAGVVDLRPVVMRGGNLRLPAKAGGLCQSEGRRIRPHHRLDSIRRARIIDFGSLSLRQRAERQREMHFQAG